MIPHLSQLPRRLAGVRQAGLIFTVRKRFWELEDRRWDRRRGVVTKPMQGADEIGLAGPSAAHASRVVVRDREFVYGTPRIGHLRAALRAVPRGAPLHLVDFGSGLGRVLFAAREAGYASATGVELSPGLCDQATENLARYRARTGALADAIEITNADATTYRIRPEHNVFYFYNPFGPPVIDAVLDRIEASMQESPRQVWVLYLNHIHRETFEARPWLRLVARLDSQRYESSLYRST